jgi:hypothetical protein
MGPKRASPGPVKGGEDPVNLIAPNSIARPIS